MSNTTTHKVSSQSARVTAYTTMVASIVGAAGSAEAAVQIVTLGTPLVISGPSQSLKLGTAVASKTSSYFKMVLRQNVGGSLAGGSSASNGSQFFKGRFFGSSSTVSNTATGGSWTLSWIAPIPGADATVYIGFRLPSTGGTMTYGWIEVDYAVGTGDYTVNRWAYQDTLDQGLTTPAASAVPGGAGLAALAIGAAGIRGRRRSRN